MAFELGDVVQLKSGGPVMTVTALSEGTKKMAQCTWFSNNKESSGNYPVEALEEFEAGPMGFIS